MPLSDLGQAASTSELTVPEGAMPVSLQAEIHLYWLRSPVTVPQHGVPQLQSVFPVDEEGPAVYPVLS